LGGSSGSPLFLKKNGLIVGQLHGGPAACGGSKLWDFYGRFSVSWDHGLSEYLNNFTPIATFFQIEDGNEYTDHRTVVLNIQGTDNPTHYMVSESADFSADNDKWKKYVSTATIKYKLSSGFGAKTLYAKLKNKVGESESVPATITYLTRPKVKALRVNNGGRTTTNHTVTLNNVATGNPDQYMVSEYSDFHDASWQAYSPAPTFTLSAGTGKKRVYFKVQNPVGISAVIKDSIKITES
jgi:hypothetical protein